MSLVPGDVVINVTVQMVHANALLVTPATCVVLKVQTVNLAYQRRNVLSVCQVNMAGHVKTNVQHIAQAAFATRKTAPVTYV